MTLFLFPIISLLICCLVASTYSVNSMDDKKAPQEFSQQPADEFTNHPQLPSHSSNPLPNEPQSNHPSPHFPPGFPVGCKFCICLFEKKTMQ
jgi:hypothetical protein